MHIFVYSCLSTSFWNASVDFSPPPHLAASIMVWIAKEEQTKGYQVHGALSESSLISLFSLLSSLSSLCLFHIHTYTQTFLRKFFLSQIVVIWMQKSSKWMQKSSNLISFICITEDQYAMNQMPLDSSYKIMMNSLFYWLDWDPQIELIAANFLVLIWFGVFGCFFWAEERHDNGFLLKCKECFQGSDFWKWC